MAVVGQSIGEVRRLVATGRRLVWWNARETARPFVEAGVHIPSCWDLGVVGALVHGLRRDDPAAVWAAAHDLPEPRPPRESLDLFDVSPTSEPITDAGQLSTEWIAGGWRESPENMTRWAELALEVYTKQLEALQRLPDPRVDRRTPSLPILTAHSESAAALLAVELEHVGLPLDRDVATQLLTPMIGTPEDRETMRSSRAAEVLRHFPGAGDVDLRSPEQVRELLARIGLELTDTRSWRLEPHAASHTGVAALLAWRKADRLETTYGWRWLDTAVAGGRLRGLWSTYDGGAGRMTAGNGLHNMPAELRSAVRAEPGYVFVRADLGQVEPRVLAAISRDEAFIAAAREADLYAPVAAALRCERPVAKVSVLAAMYGQTSGTAGAALRDMDRVYPRAMAFLRESEQAGRERHDLRTYGGRLLPFGRKPLDPDEPSSVTAGRGRYARNASVQGPAAELFKAWAATVRAGLSDLDAQIVLCLHDELLVHAAVDVVDDVTRVLHESLAATARWWAAGVDIRFIAEVGIGDSWAEAH